MNQYSQTESNPPNKKSEIQVSAMHTNLTKEKERTQRIVSSAPREVHMGEDDL